MLKRTRLLVVLSLVASTPVLGFAQSAMRIGERAFFDDVEALGGDVLVTGAGEVRRYALDGSLVQTYPLPQSPDSLAASGNLFLASATQCCSEAVYLVDGTSGAISLTIPRPAINKRFGLALAFLGPNLLVGAPGPSSATIPSGDVYLFDGTTGSLLMTFPRPAEARRYGVSFAVVGGYVVIGAPGGNPGHAYVHDATTGDLLWTLTGTGGFDGFGSHVAALGSNVVVSDELVTRMFDPFTGTLLRTFPARGPLAELDGHLVAAGPSFYDPTDGSLVREISNRLSFWNTFAVVGQALVSAHGSANFIPERLSVHCGGATGCSPCETCSPTGGCTLAPNTMCRKPSGPARSLLQIVNKESDRRDRLIWHFKGEEPSTSARDFGLPLTATDYTFCMFDGNGAEIFRAAAPAGGTCGSAPCWREREVASMFEYRDNLTAPDGLKILRLDSAPVAEEEQLHLQGNGELLENRPGGLPPIPLPLPVIAQLQAKDGNCWEATYSIARRNENGRFISRSD